MRPADTAQGEIQQTHRVIGFLCCELATLVCGNVEVAGDILRGGE